MDGRPYGTFRAYTLLVDGDRLEFRNCVFENTSGPQAQAGQAPALYLDGDGIRLTDCVLRGHQDTLFLAPLPEKEIIPGGFLGPKQFAPRKNHTVYFKNCLIEGGIDFIFGGATAYFDSCEFRSVEPGFVFAPSTPKDVKEGFHDWDKPEARETMEFVEIRSFGPGSCPEGRPDYVRVIR